MIDLKGNPFYLKDDDIQWVESTLASMTQEEKIGQLFASFTGVMMGGAKKRML